MGHGPRGPLWFLILAHRRHCEPAGRWVEDAFALVFKPHFGRAFSLPECLDTVCCWRARPAAPPPRWGASMASVRARLQWFMAKVSPNSDFCAQNSSFGPLDGYLFAWQVSLRFCGRSRSVWAPLTAWSSFPVLLCHLQRGYTHPTHRPSSAHVGDPAPGRVWGCASPRRLQAAEGLHRVLVACRGLGAPRRAGCCLSILCGALLPVFLGSRLPPSLLGGSAEQVFSGRGGCE